jgi:ribosomal small subunit protein bTHX
MTMGRGDRKTRKGKTAIRSYGNKRPHAVKKATVGKKAAVSKPVVKKPVAPVRKAAPKKT